MCRALCAAPAAAQETLTCGVPFLRTLAAGGTDTYRIAAAPGAAIQIQASAVSMPLGAVHLRLSGPDGFSIDTCTGIVQLTGRAEDLTLEVSQCFGATGGSYTLALNVVSDDPANCGRPLSCGATPDGTGFSVPGEVDSFQVALVAGQTAVFKTNYLVESGAPLLSLYDPRGNEVSPGRCAGTTTIQPTLTGTYTALVSACGPPATLDYRIEFYQPGCPIGPTLTHFGVIDATNRLVPESGSDAAGRPVYVRSQGEGWFLVVEARGGHDGKRPGLSTVPYELNDDEEMNPDLQVILSRDLGDGDPTVCDVMPPNLGGVPATVPFDFTSDSDAEDHIADMGCRFQDGMRHPLGITDSLDACTYTGQAFGFSFVDRGTAVQYCAEIDTAWAFPDGDTIVAARVKDALGNFGEPREIVVRVGDSPPATATPTPKPTDTPPSVLRTETSTRTPTRTRTATPTGPTPTRPPTPIGGTPTGTPCVGDCEGTGSVSVNDLVQMVNIAVGTAPLSECSAGDGDGNGTIEIGELVRAVNFLLDGCPTGEAD